MPLLPALFRPPPPAGSLADRIAALRAAPAEADPAELALEGGLAAGSLGQAFAVGYLAAVRRLHPHGGLAALAITEATGAHPRAIRSRLVHDGARWHLDGQKRWITLAPFVDRLLVLAAVDGHDGEARDLRIAVVRCDAPGLTLRPMPPTPFAPEVPHAELELVDVAPIAVLDQGWTRFARPFRTVEDLHVALAVAGWAARQGADWAPARRAELGGLVLQLRGLCAEPVDAPSTHVVLDAAFRGLAMLLDAVPWPAERAWERDRGLLQVADGARRARAEKAWTALRRPRDGAP